MSYEAFIDSFSGASGGVIASLVLYPLENFRTRVQAAGQEKATTEDVDDSKPKNSDARSPALSPSDSKDHTPKRSLIALFKHIIDTEGISSLYRGLQAALTGTVFSYGVYFWWYRYLKNLVSRMVKRDKFTSTEMVVITGIAGALSSVMANPIWVINTRMAIDKPDENGRRRSLQEVVDDIKQREGL